MMSRLTFCFALLLLAASPMAISAQQPTPSPAATAAEATVHVFPAKISLNSAVDRQAIVIQSVRADGITADLSASCKVRIEGEAAKFEKGHVAPVSDGEATLLVEYGSQQVRVPITVSGSDQTPAVSFQNDVMPVFSKTGCNAGSCHGAARGKDGFNLSLFGFDPKGDYQRLTREMMGRRINLAIPDDCLLTNKATGSVAHSGGSLMTRDSAYYQTLLSWLEAGAPEDIGKVPTVDKIELYPPTAVGHLFRWGDARRHQLGLLFDQQRQLGYCL